MDVTMETNKNGESCLLLAAQKGHAEVARALVDVGGKELAVLTRSDGFSALSIAAGRVIRRWHGC